MSRELIAMNKLTGETCPVIPVYFMSNFHSYGDYTGDIVYELVSPDPSGYIVFSGEVDAEGPWVFVEYNVIAENCEIIEEL